jgi:hypothetical protein
MLAAWPKQTGTCPNFFFYTHAQAKQANKQPQQKMTSTQAGKKVQLAAGRYSPPRRRQGQHQDVDADAELVPAGAVSSKQDLALFRTLWETKLGRVMQQEKETKTNAHVIRVMKNQKQDAVKIIQRIQSLHMYSEVKLTTKLDAGLIDYLKGMDYKLDTNKQRLFVNKNHAAQIAQRIRDYRIAKRWDSSSSAAHMVQEGKLLKKTQLQLPKAAQIVRLVPFGHNNDRLMILTSLGTLMVLHENNPEEPLTAIQCPKIESANESFIADIFYHEQERAFYIMDLGQTNVFRYTIDSSRAGEFDKTYAPPTATKQILLGILLGQKGKQKQIVLGSWAFDPKRNRAWVTNWPNKGDLTGCYLTHGEHKKEDISVSFTDDLLLQLKKTGQTKQFAGVVRATHMRLAMDTQNDRLVVRFLPTNSLYYVHPDTGNLQAYGFDLPRNLAYNKRFPKHQALCNGAIVSTDAKVLYIHDLKTGNQLQSWNTAIDLNPIAYDPIKRALLAVQVGTAKQPFIYWIY